MMEDLFMPKWTKSKTARYFYKYYPYKKDKNHPYYLDRKKYRNLVVDFFRMIQDHLIDGKTYYTPHGMGEYRVHKFKQKKRTARNYNLEKQYHKEHGVWKRFYHQNFHSDGEKVKVSWFTKGYTTIPYRRIYRFVPGTINTKLGRKLKTEGNIDDYYKISDKTRFKDIKTLI